MITADNLDYSISVIIPVYNGVPYVQKTLLSVIKQTLTPNEILVVNDGSTDNTLSELEKIKHEYSHLNIKLITKTNGGHSSATNVGIEASTSNFIALVDADDLWHPSKLEKQISVFKNSNDPKLGIVYSDFASIDSNDNQLPNFPTVKLDPRFKGRVYELLIRHGCYIVGSNSAVLIKKQAFLDHGYFDENLRCGEDWEMWIRLSQTYNYDYHPDVLTYIRRHAGNLSNQKLIHLRSDLYIINKWKKSFLEVGGQPLITDYLSRTTVKNLFGLAFKNDYLPLKENVKNIFNTSYPMVFILWAFIYKIFKKVKKDCLVVFS